MRTSPQNVNGRPNRGRKRSKNAAVAVAARHAAANRAVAVAARHAAANRAAAPKICPPKAASRRADDARGAAAADPRLPTRGAAPTDAV